MSGETKFSVLVSLFNWMQKSKSSAVKRSKFRKFLDSFCKPCDYFSSIRLILPSLDRERGTYGLKESVLATCLVDALGMSRDSEDAQRLFNWRRGGPRSGANAGNFAMVANEVAKASKGFGILLGTGWTSEPELVRALITQSFAKKRFFSPANSHFRSTCFYYYWFITFFLFLLPLHSME